jgi:hypothetical protein
MKFQVPQYIEIEDKIFGPLTLKQFIYLIGAGGLAFICYRFLGPLGLIFGIPIAIFGVLLAFYKHNNKPFIFLVEAAARYSINKKLYLWRKTEGAPVRKDPLSKDESLLFVPKLGEDKLKDMTWGIATKEHIKSPPPTIKT